MRRLMLFEPVTVFFFVALIDVLCGVIGLTLLVCVEMVANRKGHGETD